MEELQKKKEVSETPATMSAKKVGKPFQIVEAYKALRTNLLFTLATTERRSVIVSGAEPHAGKSTSAANLSIVMAQTNFRILLIDADMRNPSLDRIFRVSRAEGLSKVLSGMTEFEDAVCKQVAPNLDLLPAGPIPPNPQELLGSEVMKDLLLKLEQKYDYIFIDTPPVNLVADSLVMMPEVAGMLLVVREGKTTHEDLRMAQEKISHTDGRVLGILLTDVKQQKGAFKERYYKSHDYEYGH